MLTEMLPPAAEAGAEDAPEPPATPPASFRGAAPQAPERPSWFAKPASLSGLHDAAGATVVHPDALRGALSARQGAPTPVIPPIAEGVEPTDTPVKNRTGWLKRPGRGGPHSSEAAAAEAAAIETRQAGDRHTQETALEAYRRFAREGTMVSEDYYRGPATETDKQVAPAIVIAESLIPTGEPRLAPQPDKPRGSMIAAALVVLAIAGGAYYWETHQVSAPIATGVPAVALDETTAATGASFTVPAAATSGPSYRLSVPAGWLAVSQPTRPGGHHTDVTVAEPILGLSVTVRSDPAGVPDLVRGTPVDTALRVFGQPAGIVAPTGRAGSASVSRVATVTAHGVRYSLTITVRRESASRDYARADVVARSLTYPP